MREVSSGPKSRWSRRQVLYAGAAVGLSAITPGLRALSTGDSPHVLIAASSHGLSGALTAFRNTAGEWRQTHTVALASPGSVFAHPTLPVVYVAHDLPSQQHGPRGAVSAYDTTGAVLVHRGTQMLSLGATGPSYGTVLANGRSLVVLSGSSGIYNVLSLDAEGGLGAVTAIRKEYGLVRDEFTRLAAPGHVVERPDGSLLATDCGKEAVTLFHLTDDGLGAKHRLMNQPAKGGRQLVLSTCGRWAYCLHAEDSSVFVHHVTDDGLLPAHQTIAGAAGEASILLSQDGQYLLRADQKSLAALPINPLTGRLHLPRETRSPSLLGLKKLPGSDGIVGFDPASGRIALMRLSSRTGAFHGECELAAVPGCLGLAFASA